jgi:4-amino-4-deoxy-L-arabinose transferase-like glycosyltransferase
VLILLVTAALVAATALLGSSRLADGGVTQWLLGAYVIGFAEIVVLSLGLSAASTLSRWPLLVSALLVFCVALATARSARLPPFRPAASRLREALHDPPIAVVGVVVVGVIGYSIALGLFRPPNDEDALTYHLARAAFWRQQEGVGYIDGAADSRLNEFAPNSEIAMAFTMVASGTGRFAPLVQLVATLATALAVYGIARRLGLSLREGFLAGLLFVTAPAVALQASTALNDVVVASLVAAAAFFLVGATRPNLVLAGIAVALLVGSKLTGILALPGLALVSVVARRHRLPHLAAALAISAVVGGYWYAFNLAEGKAPFGGIGGERVHPDVAATISRVLRLALASVELPGAIGLDRLLYVAAAAVLAIVAFAPAGSRRERAARAALAASATLTPLLLVPLDHLLVRASQKVFFELGRGDVGYLDSDRSATKASPIFSWYGPLGVLLTLLACVIVIREVRRRRLPAVALVVAAAPALWVVLLGVGVPYWEWNGRYAMGGFALAAATWGLVLRVPPLAWAAAAIALLTVSLAFVRLHDRASGLRLIEPAVEQSVWSRPEWSIQATDHPHLRALYRFTERHVRERARIALEPNVFPGGSDLGGNLPPYPFFGPRLSRTVVFADSPGAAKSEKAEWAILRAGRAGTCAPGWKEALRFRVWVVLRRARGAPC